MHFDTTFVNQSIDFPEIFYLNNISDDKKMCTSVKNYV